MRLTRDRSVNGVEPPIPQPGIGAPGREHAHEDLLRDASSRAQASSQVADIQRARILAAMVRVVSRYGVANVTVAHIVARSGVSRRTFYELFDDREDCFLAAFDQAIGHFAQSVVPAFEQESSWRAGIRAALIALLDCLESDRDTARLMIVESLAAGPSALASRGRVLARIVSLVEQGCEQAKRGESALPPLAAEGIVGGALSVLHTRLLQPEYGSLLELAGPLTSMIVLPYLGPAAARKELARPAPPHHAQPHTSAADPLHDLDMRLTYRTVRVLTAIAEHPDSSNRQVGIASGMNDQGQISKLLSRLHRLGLIHNTNTPPNRGTPNAWQLTPTGKDIHTTITGQASQATH